MISLNPIGKKQLGSKDYWPWSPALFGTEPAVRAR